jgi:S-formylglutathione hydrolase FrmB
MTKLAAVAFALLAACNSSKPASEPAPPAVPTAQPPAGAQVQTVTFHSDALGVDKDFVLYLPASYASSTKHYPVFYYLHGLGGNEGNWVKYAHLDEAANSLGLQAIVVMPDGDNSFYIDSPAPADYDACMKDGTGLMDPSAPKDKTCVRANKYETYITKDLVGYIDAHYRTIATREGRGIAGLSMGGFGALELAAGHPDEFAATASHSGVDSLFYHLPHPYDASKVQLYTDVSTWGGEAGQIGAWIRSRFGTDRAAWDAHDPATMLPKLGPGKLAIYLDCGTEDDFGLDAGASYLHDKLVAAKMDHEFFLGPGRHAMAFWTARVPKSLAFLRDHTTAAK